MNEKPSAPSLPRTFGVIGCGLIGRKRLEALTGLGLACVAVADPREERARALAAGTGARAAADGRAVLEARPDLVVVATTHDQLAPLTRAAIDAGCHVLVEKPAARTAAELAPVLAAARDRGVMVKVGFNHRFHPALLKARELVDAGAIGPLMFIRGRYGHGGRVGYEREWRCQPELSGGGELLDQGSHLIDLARWFLGDFSEAHGTLATLFWDIPVDDNCFLTLRTAEGRVAWLHASWSEWKNLFSFEIYGRVGKLHIDGLGGSYGVERLAYYHMRPEMGPPDTTLWEYPCPDRSWQTECADLLTAIATSRPPLGTLDDAAANLRLIDRLSKR